VVARLTRLEGYFTLFAGGCVIKENCEELTAVVHDDRIVPATKWRNVILHPHWLTRFDRPLVGKHPALIQVR
jgi:hypothetical protein